MRQIVEQLNAHNFSHGLAMVSAVAMLMVPQAAEIAADVSSLGPIVTPATSPTQPHGKSGKRRQTSAERRHVSSAERRHTSAERKHASSAERRHTSAERKHGSAERRHASSSTPEDKHDGDTDAVTDKKHAKKHHIFGKKSKKVH